MGESFTATGHSPDGAECRNPDAVSSIYVHIPFCRRKCDYCAAHSRTESAPADRHRIIRTVLDHADESREAISGASTLYLGGGTPTVLAPTQLQRLFECFRQLAPHLVETSAEANPESLTSDHLAVFAANGVTRLSLGVQSLSSEVGGILGRTPPTQRLLESVRDTWSGSLSADLIFGVTQESLSRTYADALLLSTLGFDHLSIYELSVEEGTPLAQRGHPSAATFAGRDDEWRRLTGALCEAGFIRYEVSSFARDGHECAHNRAYWGGEHFLGYGPSAVSTFRCGAETVRLTQPVDHDRFASKPGFFDGVAETLTREQLVVERFLLSLRTSAGIDRARFRADFESDPVDLAPRALKSAERRELLLIQNNAIRPTPVGIDLLDAVLREIVSELDG